MADMREMPEMPARHTATLRPMDVVAVAHGHGFRALSVRAEPSRIDPYLMVDHFWMSQPTFGPHPHAGLSALTYLFDDSATSMLNRDSTGFACAIDPGDLLWTVAGRGVVHDEVPRVRGQVAHGLQVFVNLPARDKARDPGALLVRAGEMPVWQPPGSAARMRLVAGRCDDGKLVRHAGPPLPNEVMLLDVRLPAGGHCDWPTPPGRSCFVLVIGGTLQAGATRLGPGQAATVAGAGASSRCMALSDLHLVVFAGEPLLCEPTD